MKQTKRAQGVKKSVDEYLKGYRINRGGRPSTITIYRYQADAWGVKQGELYMGLPIVVVS